MSGGVTVTADAAFAAGFDRYAASLVRMTTEPVLDLDAFDDVAESSDRSIGIVMAVAGAIGTLASSVLTIDKITLLEAKIAGDTAKLGCDLNPFVSCSSVLQSQQASAFGFPNPFIGIIAFSALMTLGVVLAAGVRLPRWMWVGLQSGAVFGALFISWLQFESIFQLRVLCPWCMVVWAVTIPTVVLITRRFTGWQFLRNWTGLVISLWYIAVLAMICFQFGAEIVAWLR